MNMNSICVETGENTNSSSGNNKMGPKDGFLRRQTILQERSGRSSAEYIFKHHSYGLLTRPSEHRSKVGLSQTPEGSKDQKMPFQETCIFWWASVNANHHMKWAYEVCGHSIPIQTILFISLNLHPGHRLLPNTWQRENVTTRSLSLSLLRQFTIPVKVGTFRVGDGSCTYYSWSARGAIGCPQTMRQLRQWALPFLKWAPLSLIMAVSCLGPGKTLRGNYTRPSQI